MNIRDVINRTAQQTATNAGNELITSIRDVIKGQANRQADRQAATQRAYADNARAAQATAEGTIDFGEKEAEEPKVPKAFTEGEQGADVWQKLLDAVSGNEATEVKESEPEKLRPSVEKGSSLSDAVKKIGAANKVSQGATRVTNPRLANYMEKSSMEDLGENPELSDAIAKDEQRANEINSGFTEAGAGLGSAIGDRLADEMGRKGFIEYMIANNQPNAAPMQVTDPYAITPDYFNQENGMFTDELGLRDVNQSEPWTGGVGTKESKETSGESGQQEPRDDEGEPQLTAAIRNAFAPRSQAASYYDWLANSDEGRKFADEYGDYADDQYGYTALRASGDTEAWAKLLGLTDDYEGLDDFRNRYRSAGVDLDSDNAVDSLMNYLYGPNAVNLIDYMNYNRGSLGNEADSIADAGKYLATYYDWQPLPREQQAMGLDMDDLGYLALLHQITSNEGWGPHLTLKGVQDVANKAGEGGTFALVPEDSDEFKNNQRNNPKKYDTLDILDMLAQDTDVYEGGSSPILANASDTVIDAYNKAHKNGPRMVLR